MKLKGNYQIKQVADQKVAIYCTEDTADLRRAVSLTGSAEIICKQLLSGDEKEDLIKCLTENYDISEETAEATPKVLPHKSTPNQDADYTPPQYAAAPQPHYPKDLQRRRITGTVRVRIHINTQGDPTSVEILSSTHPSFSQTAKQAILTSWHFTPAKSGSTPVAASITTNINFALH